MNRFKLLSLLLLCAAVLCGTTGCLSKVPAGNVGIEYHMLGSSKGADIEERGPGRYWLGWNDEMYLFPTFTQNYVWEGEETMHFQDKDGMKVSSNIQISYSIHPDKADEVFRKYRRGVDEITDVVLRRAVQSQLINVGSTLSAEQIYGSGKEKLLTEVTRRVNAEFNGYGIFIESLQWSGELDMPQPIKDAIQLKVAATQLTARKQQEVQQAEADANKARARAAGEADAKLTLATADAQAIKIRGDALRDNPGLVELNAVDKWDGHLPEQMFGNAALPFVNVPTSR